MTDITLLGPQEPVANLRAALAAHGGDGRVCMVSAGWQEREGELGALAEHIDAQVDDLAVYARCEEAFASDRALFDAHRERQNHLIALQRCYRVRLAHALAAVQELELAEGPATVLDAQRRAANSALRSLDRHHVREIRCAHANFEARCGVSGHAVLRRHHDAIAREIGRSGVVLIAGGHVAVLLGRMRLLDFARLLARKTVIAWSAGAMAIADRVVLFHDHPPQGAGNPEVHDAGLGLAPGMVPLPSAGERLALGDSLRVRMFARRFAPALSLTFDNGAMLRSVDSHPRCVHGVNRLTEAGELEELTAS